MKTRAFLFFTSLLILVLHCSRSPVVLQGDVTETGNARVTGQIFNQLGLPVAGMRVQLVPKEYSPVSDSTSVSVHADTTGPDGRYSVTAEKAGEYNLQSSNVESGLFGLKRNIQLSDSIVLVENDSVKKPGNIRLVLSRTDNTTNGYIFIKGTTISAKIFPNQNEIVLTNVPAGSIPPIYYVDKSNNPEILVDSATVVPSDTIVPVTSKTAKLFLNTAQSGANVLGQVRGFPVLVRLDANTFTFSEAKPGGEDVRFFKPDLTPLPYEIEKWDSKNSQAVVWVKVDTVRGNDSTQYLLMTWGNKNSIDASSSSSVFETANGFQAVWHMDQAGNTSARDATANQFDGTPNRMSASLVPGIIGNAQVFSGDSSYITIANSASGKLDFSQDGAYTLSAWVNPDSIDGLFHNIISKGDLQYGLDLHQYKQWQFYVFLDNQGWAGPLYTKPEAHAWSYIVGVRGGASSKLYVNGSCVDSSMALTANVVLRDSTNNVTIGALSERVDRVFKGAIDEVALSNVSRSADWIRLCYMNQQEQDALVKIKK